MITLTNGRIQNQAGIIVPDGSITFQLNTDATIIAAPYGIIPAEQVVSFQFDSSGNILPNAGSAAAQIWSNKELQPQNINGLGTYYLVTFYDANGARINKSPMWWQFPEAANATVDISNMIPFLQLGGNVIYYPVGSGGGVTSVALAGDGTIFNSTPSLPVTSVGTLSPLLLVQSPNTVLAGPASGAGSTYPTFRALVPADIPASSITPAGLTTQVQINKAGALYADANFTFDPVAHLLTASGSIRAGFGTLASAAFGFATEVSTGFYWSSTLLGGSAIGPVLTSGGYERIAIDVGVVGVRTDSGLSWLPVSTTHFSGAGQDTGISRPAAGTISVDTTTVGDGLGTILTANGVFSVSPWADATAYSGADIGAKINAAYLALPASGGQIFVPAGTYSYLTPIVLATSGKFVTLFGVGGVVNLVYTPTSGVAITMDYTPTTGDGWVMGHGIRDINLYNVSTTLTNGGPNKTAEITAWSTSGTVATFTAKNNFVAGESVTLIGFTTKTVFNGVTATVSATGLSGTQFEIASLVVAASGTEYGIAYESTNTATGIFFGGTYSGAQQGLISNVLVGGFQTNIGFSSFNPSSNSFGMSFEKVSSVNGTFGYFFPATAYENMRMTGGGMIAENSVGVYQEYGNSVDLFVEGASLDSNTISGVYCPLGGQIVLVNCHMENNGIAQTHFVNSNHSSCTIVGGFILNDNTSSTTDWLVRFAGAGFCYGAELYSQGQTVTQAFLVPTSAQAVIACHNNNPVKITTVGGAGTWNDQSIVNGSAYLATLPAVKVLGTSTLGDGAFGNAAFTKEGGDELISTGTGGIYFGAYSGTPQVFLAGSNGGVGIGTNTVGALGTITATAFIPVSATAELTTDTGLTGGLRVAATTTNDDANLGLLPNGSSTTSNIEWRNSSDPANVGVFNIKLIGTTVYFESLAVGGGALPTIINTTGMIVTALTASPGTNTTQVATTAFVTAAAAGGGVPPTDVQIFTTVGAGNTWTKPAGSPKWTEIVLISGGGGGATASGSGAGSGGGGGAIVRHVLATTLLGSTETVTVGDGGTAGNTGATSAFGNWIQVLGGGPGLAGSGGGGVGAVGTVGSGGTGGVGKAAQGNGNVGLQSNNLGAGGGGGGSEYVTSGSQTGGIGGAGGAMHVGALAGGTAGSAPSTNGGTGTGVTAHETFGGAGGGGGGSSNGHATNGGIGGIYGGGGGGGGYDSQTPLYGTGGKGGQGIVIVISYF